MQTASKKVINGWAMYDWSNSVYNLVITSTIFPAYTMKQLMVMVMKIHSLIKLKLAITRFPILHYIIIY